SSDQDGKGRRGRRLSRWLRRGAASACSRSERVDSALTRSDPDDLVDWQHEDLAVADLPGLSGALDCFDDARSLIVVDHYLDLHLWQEVNHVFGSFVELGVPSLPTEALHFHCG